MKNGASLVCPFWFGFITRGRGGEEGRGREGGRERGGERIEGGREGRKERK